MQIHLIDTPEGYIEILADSEASARAIAAGQNQVVDLVKDHVLALNAEAASWENEYDLLGDAATHNADLCRQEAARIYFQLWDDLGYRPSFDL